MESFFLCSWVITTFGTQRTFENSTRGGNFKGRLRNRQHIDWNFHKTINGDINYSRVPCIVSVR